MLKNNLERYREKAIEACKQVYELEYHNSIGIPIPEITFMTPDKSNYNSGQYYIYVGDTWQIHLDFGKLPKNYAEFQEEVRVLTRHEVEHYMCCPYNLLIHLRMLKVIQDVMYDLGLSNIGSVSSLSASLANQVADIIIDTVNFYRNKAETLKSERNWIKKSGVKDFSKLAKHEKLMFLTKGAVWKEDLGLNEKDEALINEVEKASLEFERGGVDNKDLFLEKTEYYTRLYFKLYEEEQEKAINNEQHRSGEQESQGESGDGSGNQGDEKEAENNNSDDGQSGGNGQQQADQVDGQNGHAPDTNSEPDNKPKSVPAKDSQEDGGPFVFQSLEQIKEQLSEFAKESDIEEFQSILNAAGLTNLSVEDRKKIWFDAQHQDIIPIIENLPLGTPEEYSYPSSWKLGDPVEDLDMMLSFSISPVLIPGVTTKKWEKFSNAKDGVESSNPDLLLVLDTSGSMGVLDDRSSNLHQAVLASFGIIKFFESKRSKVALIGFSNIISTEVEWTSNYSDIRDKLLLNSGGGTKFPIQRIKKITSDYKNPLVTVIITDGEINNDIQTIEFFKDYLSDGNKLFIFLQDTNSKKGKFDVLSNYGASVLFAHTANDMRDLVLESIY